jgi:hypothetical protein
MYWRDVSPTSNYQVSNSGHVRSKITMRELHPSENGRGVLKVLLSEDGEHVTRTVARLVGEQFVPGYEEGFVIVHVDDDHYNCNASNLVWRPRWFAQEWAYQLKRTHPMRPFKILMESTGQVYENSLICAKENFCIEKYIVLACGRGDSIYNGSKYSWIRE